MVKKYLHIRLGVSSILGLSALIAVVAMTTPAHSDNNNQCFSICKYEDSTGHTYVGESGSDCTSACDMAQKECNDGGKGGCQQVGECTSTNCG